MSIESQLTSHLLKRGVAPIWINGALRTIRLTTNSYFATNVTIDDLILNGDKIKRLALRMTLEYPDLRTKVDVIMDYRFDPKRKLAHQCKMHLAGKSTFIPA